MSMPSPSHSYHVCGGDVLAGPLTDDGRQYYCGRCGAFCYSPDDEPIPKLPSGADRSANQAAYDDGRLQSPDAD